MFRRGVSATVIASCLGAARAPRGKQHLDSEGVNSIHASRKLQTAGRHISTTNLGRGSFSQKGLTPQQRAGFTTSVSDSKSTFTYWVQSHAGGSPFRVTPTSSDIDSLKDAIKAKMGPKYPTLIAPDITILDPDTKEPLTRPSPDYIKKNLDFLPIFPVTSRSRPYYSSERCERGFCRKPNQNAQLLIYSLVALLCSVCSS
jgi:hypothetical protein